MTGDVVGADSGHRLDAGDLGKHGASRLGLTAGERHAKYRVALAALGDFLGAGHGNQRQHLLAVEVIADGKSAGGIDDADDDVDVWVLDQLLRLFNLDIRLALVVCGDHLDWLAADLVVMLFEIESDRIFDNLRPEQREDATIWRKDSDLDRLGLSRDRPRRPSQPQRNRGSDHKSSRR